MTRKRRAEENPSYRGRESGIVVLRGDQVITKKGTCLYPGETLLGGWCRVLRELNGREIEEYKEVGLKEYDKGQANWKSKPCTMIEKVAVSQALRAAFPKDFTGLYTAEEMGSETESMGRAAPGPGVQEREAQQPRQAEVIITKEQRKEIFDVAGCVYGSQAVEKVRAMTTEMGFDSTTNLTVDAYNKIMERMSRDQDAISADGSVE